MDHHLDHAYRLGQQLAEFEKESSLLRFGAKAAPQANTALMTARAGAFDRGTYGALLGLATPAFTGANVGSLEHVLNVGAGTGAGALLGGASGLVMHKLLPARYSKHYRDYVLRGRNYANREFDRGFFKKYRQQFTGR
tara:strand:- start:3022 stop:3435 length:414 start_codon:yes stop_codon:yes gene_type:complete